MTFLRAVDKPGGTVLLDLDDGVSYAWLHDTLLVSTQDTASAGGGGAQTIVHQTQIDERYGGLRTDYEDRSNGTVQWSAYVTGVSSAALAANVGALIALVENPAQMFIERQDPGWTGSLFYERRGAGQWTEPMYDPVQMMAQIDVAFPIAPAARGTATTTTVNGVTAPADITLPATPGNLPALVDVAWDLAATPEAWGLIAPYAPSTALWGLVTAPSLTPTGLTLSGDAGAVGGQSLKVPGGANVAPSTTYAVDAYIDPSTVLLDSFEQDVAVEVWIRIYYDCALVFGATLMASAFPPGGVGAVRASSDMPNGRPLTDGATAGGNWHIHRVGILRLPSEPGSGSWAVRTTIVTGPVASGSLNVDYVMFVPSRHRACSPTGVGPTGYPRLLASSAVAQTKTIDHTGKGSVSLISGVAHSDAGMGGAPLRILPGPSGGVVLAASPSIPDDPTATAGRDAFGYGSTVRVTVTPRYSLLSSP